MPRGKHGEVQIEGLFKKIGLCDALKGIKIENPAPSLLDVESYIDIPEFIAEVTKYRNRAIHEGTQLHTFISIEKVNTFIETTNELLSNIAHLLNRNLVTKASCVDESITEEVAS